jgi:hypothetical protein
MVALVSSRSETEIKQLGSQATLAGYARAAFSEMCRVAAGAGNVDAALKTLVGFHACLSDIEEDGDLTKAQIQAAFQSALRLWLDNSLVYEEDDPAQDIETIARGSLRFVASELTGNRTQAALAQTQIYDGVIAIEQIRQKNAMGHDAWEERQAFTKWRASVAYRKWAADDRKANGFIDL